MKHSTLFCAIELELENLNLIPACRAMAVSWLGQMAISFTVSSIVDDFMFKAKGQAMRDTKRSQLTHLLAFCMDNGYTAQMAETEIKASIKKEAESSFEAKSHSQKTMELLVACGEDEDALVATLAEENLSGTRIHAARKNKLDKFIGEIQGQMYHMLANARGLAWPELDNIPGWMTTLIATKVQMAEEQHRKYLIRGISRGMHGNAGALTLLNTVLKQGKMAWVCDRVEEEKRESQYDDNGCNHEEDTRQAGDGESKDITY